MSIRWGWRVAAVVVALAVVTVPWDARTSRTDLLAVIPVLVWAVRPSRYPRTGLIVAAVLITLMAWVVVPRTVGWTGRWLVPSQGDTFTWYPWLAAAVCAVGAAIERRQSGKERRAWPFTVVVLIVLASCFLTCPLWWVASLDATAGDEGLLPLPAGLTVIDSTHECGTQSCGRAMTVGGPDADTRMRAHLAARGYHLRRDGPQVSDGSHSSAIRSTGILVPHRVDLGYTRHTDGTVELHWNVVAVLELIHAPGPAPR